MASYLGPLSSISGGSRLFYVDLQNQLNIGETVTSIDAPVSSHDTLAITSGTILGSSVLTKDGHYLYSGQAVQFLASASGNFNFLGHVVISYHTNLGGSDTTLVYLKVVPSI